RHGYELLPVGRDRAVPPDQADALATVDMQVHAIEQRRTAEAQADVEETDDGHRNGNRAATALGSARHAAAPWRISDRGLRIESVVRACLRRLPASCLARADTTGACREQACRRS